MENSVVCKSLDLLHQRKGYHFLIQFSIFFDEYGKSMFSTQQTIPQLHLYLYISDLLNKLKNGHHVDMKLYSKLKLKEKGKEGKKKLTPKLLREPTNMR
jgi:hypothetical protein